MSDHITEANVNTVVIVDSDVSEHEALKQMLGIDAYHFETARTGNEAKEIIRRLGADTTAIIADWHLPDVDGIELLRWVQGQPFGADIEVIVHAEEFVNERVEAAIDCGAYYYLTKPIEEPQLEAIVRAAVESVEQRRALAHVARETRDAVRLLRNGVFRLQTFEEAELLATHLASASGHPDLSLAIRELLVNAVEHGNLGITYDEKGRLLQEGALIEECQRRLNQASYQERYVIVTLDREAGGMLVSVTDEGDGFDFNKYQTIDADRLFDLHGRGVLIASAALALEYVPPGNRVKFTLPLDS